MLRTTIDPDHSQLFLDSCAFDPGSPEDEAANELWSLFEQGKIHLTLTHSNQREINHPNTPAWVKRRALGMVSTLDVSLTPGERQQKADIHDLLRGNATKLDAHKDDAEHIFEASKYGGYFLTTDDLILRRADAIYWLCQVQVMKPSEGLARLEI